MSRQKRLRTRANLDPEAKRVALRTAFISRFIVLREEKKSKAHRAIEQLEWSKDETAEGLLKQLEEVFRVHGENMAAVERDLVKALEHAVRSVDHFMEQYLGRSTTNFADALRDHKRSNSLLFSEDLHDMPSKQGWKVPPAKRKFVFGPRKPAKVFGKD